MSELKACAHCGIAPITRMNAVSTSDMAPRLYAICLECGHGLPIEKWQRRADNPAVNAALERAVKRLQELRICGNTKANDAVIAECLEALSIRAGKAVV